MKLYSRFQMIRRTLSGVIVGALLACAAFYITKTESQNEGEGTSQTSQVTQAESEESAPQASPVSREEEELSIIESQEVVSASATVAKDSGFSQDEQENISVYEKCNEAVVNITTQVMGVNWFFEPIVQDGGSGSGSIIDKRGYVITNVHVISNARKITISLFDGTSYEGTVVGQDEESDIAILKFDPPENVKLSTIDFGSSDSLKVGQKVIAIGNPFGLERTMTTGIVSGLGRPIQESSSVIIRNMIQTDAAINPGNSGGPLLDTKGKMIGINTMIISNSGSSAGIGFAVPVSTARRVSNDLLKYGKVRRGTIQIKGYQLTRSIAQYAGLDISSGILVSEVKEGSGAAKAGLKGGTKAVQYGSRFNYTTIYLGGDVITKIDNISVASYADYTSALESKRPGDTVSLTVRRDGKDVKLKVTLDGSEADETSQNSANSSKPAVTSEQSTL